MEWPPQSYSNSLQEVVPEAATFSSSSFLDDVLDCALSLRVRAVTCEKEDLTRWTFVYQGVLGGLLLEKSLAFDGCVIGDITTNTSSQTTLPHRAQSAQSRCPIPAVVVRLTLYAWKLFSLLWQLEPQT